MSSVPPQGPGSLPPTPPGSGFQPPTQHAAPPPSSRGSKPRPQRAWLVATVVVAVVAAAVAALVVVGGDDSGNGPLEPQSIVLEPVGAQPPDPFMDEDLDLGGVNAANLGTPPELSDQVTSGLSGTAASGDIAGLYGGSQDAAICDVQRQIDFLTDPANADKAEAWAQVQDIEVAQLAQYLGGLVPVRLRFDTRVTNHSFSEGEAAPFQSILQAGTAVLLDDHGVPRSKCFCGNPLGPPITTDENQDPTRALDTQELAKNPEDAWEGFDPAAVVTVKPSPEQLTEIVVAEDGGQHTPIQISAGDEQTSDYMVDQLEAALPADDELRQHYTESVTRPCDVRQETWCDHITGLEGSSLPVDTGGGGFYRETLNIQAGIYTTEEVSATIDDPGNTTDTPYSVSDWRGWLRTDKGQNGDNCSLYLFIGHLNALIEISVFTGEADCAPIRQRLDQYASQMVDALR